MSKLPECIKCGNYISHGNVICQDCLPKDDTSIITLTPLLTSHYAALAAQEGKPVSELVARDLDEYQEYRRHLENEYERL